MTPAPSLPVGGDEVVPGPGDFVPAAGGVVIDGRNGQRRVLVVHRPAYGDWSLPKGHIDAGETPATAAAREVVEETGVAVRIVRELGTTEYAIGPRIKRVHWFLMERAPDAMEPDERPSDVEVDIAAWWDTDAADRRLTHAQDRELVRRALTPSREAI